jgi:hypothetical protein
MSRPKPTDQVFADARAALREGPALDAFFADHRLPPIFAFRAPRRAIKSNVRSNRPLRRFLLIANG